jgi:SAM-dependent methyltransferase
LTEVHQVAAKGFGAEAAAYDRGRPSYPPDAVDWLASMLRIRPGCRVADLAAGTGKLTELLASRGCDLVAVEPVGAMRNRLRTRLPDTALVAGVAEAMPLAAASLDAVTVAQAFHWFHPDQAMAELARVIRPGGRLGLIWNARDRGVDWVDRVWTIMDRVERHAPWRDHGQGGPRGASRWSERVLAERPGWSPWTEATFYHVQRLTHDQVIDRIRSVSHIAALPPARQQAVLGEIAAILTEHPDTRDVATVSIGYRVDVRFTERLDHPAAMMRLDSLVEVEVRARVTALADTDRGVRQCRRAL